MSTRYPGGVITKTPVVPAGPYENGTAPGIWTLDQQLQAQKAGIWPTAGNVDPSQFIENIFSTYLYTGTGATQTITNGIDLSGKGGLTWIKSRTNAFNHTLVDTVRGATNLLVSNTSAAQATQANSLTAFTSTGFSIGAGSIVNYLDDAIVSWTFREQPKFFDIVTYTGTGVAGLNVNHNLGSAPGCMFVKRTDASGSWHVFHTSLGGTKALFLNGTNAALTNIRYWNDTAPTSTVFTLGFDTDVNASGGTYVAYLFAHDAGGFGLTGTDNVISCGSYAGTGVTGNSVTLGYEPQWVLIKNTTGGASWALFDTMRGMPVATNSALLSANTSAAEDTSSQFINPTATGFTLTGTGNPVNGSGTYIYIAIRRGPMKVPTDATKVFTPTKQTSTGYTQITGLNFAPDFVLQKAASSADNWDVVDKLRGPFVALRTNTTDAESASDTQYFLGGWLNDGVKMGSDPSGQFNGWNPNSISFFRRAPGFFDEVCYTGTGSPTTITHNLSVVPELIIVKSRIATAGDPNWTCYSAALGTSFYVRLNQDLAKLSAGSTYWNSTSPTSTVFSVGDGNGINTSGVTYVAYLFATAAGVSKVGSYTGTGTTQTINCGFTAGARFVLIKRTDSTGDWYVWDSARGIVAGNDPYLLLNSTAAEVTGTDYVDTAASGFEISSTAPAAINANGGSFIFLSIA